MRRALRTFGVRNAVTSPVSGLSRSTQVTAGHHWHCLIVFTGCSTSLRSNLVGSKAMSPQIDPANTCHVQHPALFQRRVAAFPPKSQLCCALADGQAQLLCSNLRCRTMLTYPRGARQVQCSVCSTISCAAAVRPIFLMPPAVPRQHDDMSLAAHLKLPSAAHLGAAFSRSL